ncbi:tyrosine-type recombinase/integrase [Sorangium cellulosum]|uniref:tyrosine-type recombinase/integrase n=1 Tax=Sorangium cellulosum TaxID=56 RepID=UPI0011DE513C|nr:tyrosine-type recombinase/integrase [Sorangium cellulosum]
MTDVPQRRARAKRSASFPTSSLPAPASTDRRSRSSRSGGRPAPAAPVVAPVATSPGAASTTEHPKLGARAPSRPAGDKRANGSGSVRLRGKTWTARLSLGEAGRPTFSLPTCRTEQEANARLEVLADLAGRLLAAGQIVLGLPLLEQAAAREGRALHDVRLAIEQLCKGEARARPSGEITFAEFAELVVSGRLAEQYPLHVKALRRPEPYRHKLNHVLEVLGPIPLPRLTLDHADRAISMLPAHLEASSRQGIAKFIHRILALATYPARIIANNPLPRGWIPKADDNKAKGSLYPDEDRRLMAAVDIPLSYRIYYGFLIREGMRADEAGRLEPSDLDLDRGAVVLDENKTDDPRAWALSPDVVRALRAYFAICPPKERVFIGPNGPLPGRSGAKNFRNHLRRAGIDRPELFETTQSRLNIRLHDTRATFITIKLANGRTETWISDRTGHKSSRQIHNYKRAARKVAELGLGDFAPLDEAIPELNGKSGPVGGSASTSAGLEERSPSPSYDASLVRALPDRAPSAVDDDAGQPTGGNATATGAALGPRWAKPATRPAADRLKASEIIEVSSDPAASPQESWRDS